MGKRHKNAQPAGAKSNLERLGAILLILTGLLANSRALESVLSADGAFTSLTERAAIWAIQAAFLAAGLLILVRRPLPAELGLAAVGLGLFGFVFSSYAMGRYLEWVQPPVQSLRQICEAQGSLPFLGSEPTASEQAEVHRLRSVPGKTHEALEDYRELADRFLRHGKNEKAIELLETARAWAEAEGLPVSSINLLRATIGMAHLRQGEVTHCIDRHNSTSCLYPLAGDGVWTTPTEANLASQHFEEILRSEPENLSARWLLNIAHMAAGTHPDGVPTDFLIEARDPISSTPITAYRDVAPQLGLGAVNLAGGAILDDFDNDGFLDIVTSTYAPCETLLYFHNDGDGGFSNWSERAGLGDQLGGFNLVQTDFNNDGLLDIYVIRGAWMRNFGRQRDSLLRQNPDGSFTDVTAASGMGETAYPNLASVWADYDNDGDLDLFLGNERLSEKKIAASQLFRNEGDGTFTEVARQAGVQNLGDVQGATWGDYDNDGYVDLYVSNLGDLNRLYHNDGDGTFSERGEALGVASQAPGNRTFGAWFWDYDNDGWLDLYVGGYGALGELGEWVADYVGLPSKAERLTLYRNERGRFRDVTREVGLYEVQMPMAANFGDIDNDGYLDFYLGTGAPTFEYLVPNVLYRNDGGQRFVDVTTDANVGHLQKGHGIAFGDLDNDGDQDIYAQMGGWYPADRFANALFENPGYSNHWIAIKLVGVRSNRAAIGARLKLSVRSEGKEREIHHVVGSGGSFGASSLLSEVGLGSAERIELLEIWWPATGARQVFRDVPADQFIEVTEFETSYRPLERETLRFADEASKAEPAHHHETIATSSGGVSATGALPLSR